MTTITWTVTAMDCYPHADRQPDQPACGHGPAALVGIINEGIPLALTAATTRKTTWTN
jgi:hypothetical protein